MAIGSAAFDIVANLNPLTSALSTAGGLAMKIASSIGNAVLRVVSYALNKLIQTIKIATVSFLAFGALSVRAFSELERTGRLFNAVFGASAETMNKWIAGISETSRIGSGTLQSLTANLHLLIEEIAGGGEKAQNLTKETAKMILGLRAMFGGELEEYIFAVQNGLYGMARTLRRYGLAITEEEIKQRALNDELLKTALLKRANEEANANFLAGFGWLRRDTQDLTKYLNENEKAYLRLMLMLEKYKKVQIRFGLFQSGFSDTFFILREQITDTMEAFGKGLAPAVQRLMSAMADYLYKNQARFEKYGEVVGNILMRIVNLVLTLVSTLERGGLSQLMTAVKSELASAFQALRPYAEELGKWIAYGFISAFTAGLKTLNPFKGITQQSLPIQPSMAWRSAYPIAF